jgi:hypothetical protein
VSIVCDIQVWLFGGVISVLHLGVGVHVGPIPAPPRQRHHPGLCLVKPEWTRMSNLGHTLFAYQRL